MNQGYDEAGRPTDKPLSKEEAQKGALHGSAHVWLWQHRHGIIEVLLQRRSLDKKTWPGYWDISAAGHMDFGEMPFATAIRETKEELDISLRPDELRLLMVFREYMVADKKKPLIENEIQFVYGYELTKLPSVTLQQEEVAALEWVNLTQLQSMVMNPEASSKQLVPHAREYWIVLQKELQQLAI